MKHTPTPKETWKINGEYIEDLDGSPRFRVMGTQPYNQEWLNRTVKAVNNYEPLKSALENLFNDWATLVGEDLKENNEDVKRLWNETEKVLRTTLRNERKT